MGNGMMLGGYGFGGEIMWLFWILLAIAVLGVVWATFLRGNTGDRNRKTPLQILQDRYAKGEIDRQELTQRRKDLVG